MSNKEMKTRIVHKHDLEKNWDRASNFIPLEGEIIIYDIEQSANDLPEGRTVLYNYPRIKIGDGVHSVSSLSFVNNIATDDEIMALLSKCDIVTSVSDSTDNIYLDIDNKILVY